MIAGVDGCSLGWIAAVEGARGEGAFYLFRDFAEILQHSELDLVVIDVPIGLTETGPRGADVDARKLLERRGCCVFPAPIRSILNSSSRQEASERRRLVEGKGVSAQLWGIMPKIAAVDRVMRANPDLQERVREGHPEVSFLMMNGGRPILAPKAKAEGGFARLALLAKYFVGMEHWVKHLPRYRVDILDAFALLWTARRVKAGTETSLPKRPEPDAFGLHPRIVA